MAGKWWLPRWWLYRPIMKLAHRFDWHWMPPSYPENDIQLWCQWCGARYTIPRATVRIDKPSERGCP